MSVAPLTTAHLREATSCINVFVGPAEHMPKKKIKSGIFIANLSYSYEGKGSHWILLSLKRNGELTFFDSLALNMLRPPQLAFIHKNAKKIIYCKKRVQSFTSSTCGYWCLVFAHFINQGGTLDQFLNVFTNDFRKNDDVIVRQSESMFGKLSAKRRGGQTCVSYIKRKKRQ